MVVTNVISLAFVEAIESSVVSRLVSRLDKDDKEDELVSRLVVDDVSFRSVDERELKVVNSFLVLISGIKLVNVDVVEVVVVEVVVVEVVVVEVFVVVEVLVEVEVVVVEVVDDDDDDDDRKGVVVEVIIPLFPHKPKLKSVISFKFIIN